MRQRVVFSWSGGKDSALALHEINTNQRYSRYIVTKLLTTVTEGYDRISGHGVRNVLLARQAASIGVNVQEAYIHQKSTMDEYESVMEEAYLNCRSAGSTTIAFGDIFLKKLQKRRLESLDKIQMAGLFPLWQRGSRQIAKDTIALGFKAYVVCVDARLLDKSFVGRCVDEDFLRQLPVGIDPCGENGEFHTFVWDGPLFREQVRCKLGDIVLRGSNFYCDVLPDD